MLRSSVKPLVTATCFLFLRTSTPNHQAEILARTIRAEDADLSADAARSLLSLRLPDNDGD